MLNKIFFLAVSLSLIAIPSRSAFAKQNIYPELAEIEEYYKSSELTSRQDKRIKDILREFKDDSEFNFQLGKFFLKSYRPLEAEQIFKDLYEVQPKDKYEVAYGKSLMMQKRYSEILEKIDPNAITDDLRAHKLILIAHSYFALDDYKKALKTIDAALEIHPDQQVFITFKARCLTAMNKTDEALELIDSLEDKGYKSRKMLVIKAEIYNSTKNYSKALEIYNQIITIDDDYTDAYSGRARVNLKLNNPKDAMNDGLFLVKKDPRNPIGPFIIASALTAQGKHGEALKFYDGRGDERKSFYPGLLLEGEIHFNNNNAGHAQILLNKYLKIAASDPKALRLMGIIKVLSGNAHDALGYLKQAYLMEKDNPDLLVALAQAYYITGNIRKSEKIFTELQNKFPYNSAIANDAFKLSCKFKSTRKNNAQLCDNRNESEIAQQIFEALNLIYVNRAADAYTEIFALRQTFPENRLINQYYARILRASGKTDDAVHMLFDMLQSDDYRDNIQILHDLYGIYISGLSTIDIITQLRKIYDQDPAYGNIGNYLVDFYYRNKNYPEAVQITKLMLKNDPNNQDLLEMLLKLTTYDLDNLYPETQKYLATYVNKTKDTAGLFYIMRQSIMFNKFDKVTFKELNQVAGTKTAHEFQVLAEYLDFIKQTQQANNVYKQAITKFPQDLNLYDSAFAFYQKDNKLNKLSELFEKFQGKDLIDRTIFKAKYLNTSGRKDYAVATLQNEFMNTQDGRLAYALLKLDPSDRNAQLVEYYLDKVQNNHYKVAFLLGEIFLKQNKFGHASDILLRYRDTLRGSHPDYKFLLAQSNFYNNFEMAHDIIKGLTRQFPDNQEYILSNIAYAAKSDDFDRATTLFENTKPSLKEYPSLNFYYAYALWGNNKKDKAVEVLSQLLEEKIEFIERPSAEKLIKKYQEEKTQA